MKLKNDYKIVEKSYNEVKIEVHGRIYTICRNGDIFYQKTGHNWHKPKTLKFKGSKNVKNRYISISLRDKNGIGGTEYAHRLVAFYFVENPYNKKYVNHKDGDKWNNSADNLEWVSSSENHLHSYANKLHPTPSGRDLGGGIFHDVKRSRYMVYCDYYGKRKYLTPVKTRKEAEESLRKYKIKIGKVPKGRQGE